MANRAFDNVIIIDSAMGNLSAVGGTSANVSSYHVTGFAFLATTTASACVISGANTADAIFRSLYITNETGSTAIVFAVDRQSFAQPLRLSSIKVPLITTGTAWVYLA